MTKTISVRLDEKALRALRQLEKAGASRSGAVRSALVEASARRARLAEEAAAVAADLDDQREVAAVQGLMDELSEPW